MNSLRIDPEPKCIFTWVVHVLRGLYYYLTLGLPSRLLSYFLQAFLVHPLASLLFLVQIVHLDPILIGGIDIDLIVARIAEAGNTEVDNHCLLRRHTLKNKVIFKIICRKRLPKNFQKKKFDVPYNFTNFHPFGGARVIIIFIFSFTIGFNCSIYRYISGLNWHDRSLHNCGWNDRGRNNSC